MRVAVERARFAMLPATVAIGLVLAASGLQAPPEPEAVRQAKEYQLNLDYNEAEKLLQGDPFHQNGIFPFAVQFCNLFPAADGTEAALLMQFYARRILGENPRLQRPDPPAFAFIDERQQQYFSDPFSTPCFMDINALLADAGVAFPF